MYVLLSSINDYNQCGDYFVACWKSKPTVQNIKNTMGNRDSVFINHILEGGGRTGVEDMWYTLIEIEEGKNYYYDPYI